MHKHKTNVWGSTLWVDGINHIVMYLSKDHIAVVSDVNSNGVNFSLIQNPKHPGVWYSNFLPFKSHNESSIARHIIEEIFPKNQFTIATLYSKDRTPALYHFSITPKDTKKDDLYFRKVVLKGDLVVSLNRENVFEIRSPFINFDMECIEIGPGKRVWSGPLVNITALSDDLMENVRDAMVKIFKQVFTNLDVTDVELDQTLLSNDVIIRFR